MLCVFLVIRKIQMSDNDYDVVLDTLQKQRDILWKMTQQNMNADMFNIMDQIRLEQIDQLDKAIQSYNAMIPLRERINEYLSAGGLFNSEMMEHEKVRDMLIEIRDAI